MKREHRQVGDTSVEAGRGPGQLAWYEFAANFVKDKTVLDVGCGLGKGIEILKKTARSVRGQDLDDRLASKEIMILPLNEIPSKSFDVVTSVDVIEHVEQDATFVAELSRIAREGVFITTPNWSISRCAWPYHLREYTPRQLEELLAPHGVVSLFKGNSSGTEIYPVKYTSFYHLANALRINSIAQFPTRLIGKVLPKRMRIGGHNAAFIKLNQ